MKLGWRPDLDRTSLEEKVGGLLTDLHVADLLSVSNGTMGDIIAANVAARCRDLDRYDQYTIIAQIYADPNLVGHADYWAKRAADPEACPHLNMDPATGGQRCRDCGQYLLLTGEIAQ